MSEIPPPTVPPATPPPPPPPAGTSPSSDRTLMIVLSYLGLLALIPYLTKKEDADIHWHAKNGVGLLILDVVIWVVFLIITWVLPSNLLGCGVGMIQCVVWIGILVLHVYCIVQGVGGKRPRIPVVTDFAEKTL
ncbi:MAG TPA: hypothetical protein VGQ36_22190 [Thermoanaerobaculia bacterium]|nr:hypothetical protein [Thermoanaerobaculia bacterium]